MYSYNSLEGKTDSQTRYVVTIIIINMELKKEKNITRVQEVLLVESI